MFIRRRDLPGFNWAILEAMREFEALFFWAAEMI